MREFLKLTFQQLCLRRDKVTPDFVTLGVAAWLSGDDAVSDAFWRTLFDPALQAPIRKSLVLLDLLIRISLLVMPKYWKPLSGVHKLEEFTLFGIQNASPKPTFLSLKSDRRDPPSKSQREFLWSVSALQGHGLMHMCRERPAFLAAAAAAYGVSLSSEDEMYYDVKDHVLVFNKPVELRLVLRDPVSGSLVNSSLQAELDRASRAFETENVTKLQSAQARLRVWNILKPALSRGEIQCIGATTLDEYRQYIEKDGALERRFQKVIVEPTTVDETIQILNNIKEKYEDHHNVTFTPEAIEACVKLTNRYITDRHLPDKAIDALDEAGSRVHISNIVVPKNILEVEQKIEEIKEEKNKVVRSQRYEEAAKLRDRERQLLEELDRAKKAWEEESRNNRTVVTEENVAEVVAMMSGIPVNRIAEKESGKLRRMKEEMIGKVIGQDEAVAKVVKAIQRNRAGLKDPNRPIGSFIFLGPTGVGKTQLAKELARYMFDTEDALIRIDMSEYMEKFSVSRLIGAPPGYVGYEEGGQLTEKVRRRPYSIVLLDEIEKAHPDVFNLLLQALDDGKMTDSLGRHIDFKNAIIIMTSNIGARDLSDFGKGVGFGTAAKMAGQEESNRGIIEKALKKAFAPEFLNRIDDIIMFNSLKREDIHKIIDIELGHLYKRIAELGYELKLTDEAKDFLSEKGYDEKFGARPLKRAIQKYIEDPLAEEIINQGVEEGDKITVSLNKEKSELSIKVTKGKKKVGKGEEGKEAPPTESE